MKKVFVAMSGGVDSSVAAYLLKKQGYQVTGVFMRNWSDPLSNYCPWKKDIKDFKQVCKVLKIPTRIEIFEEEYRKKVVHYLISGYKRGITPNPDMLCNSEIKFKVFLNKARGLGADYIATGHYVVNKINKQGIYNLYISKDKNKDQSYFLALLNQKQLKCSLFPVGIYTKAQVRKIAEKAQLSVYNKKDSQGICFIGKIKFKDFIRQFIKGKQGLIMDSSKRVIGHHDGLAFYTIGQRHGLGIGGGAPYYVADKDYNKNILIVAKGRMNKLLYCKKINIKKISWISGRINKLPLTCRARIRYRQKLNNCIIKKAKKGYLVEFNKGVKAVTPGQFIVFYNKDVLLGGGVIE